MTKVTMYQANDGSLHKTPKECDAKNVELRTAPLVEEFVNGLNEEHGITSVNENGELGVHLVDLPGFIVAHADALRTLLNKAVNPVGRPRKGSADAAKPRKPRADKGTKRGTPASAEPKTSADTVVNAAAKVATGDPLDDVLADLG
jgi:hypothetical protein